MARERFSFVTGENERVRPLIVGEVEPEGAELIVTRSNPSETFWRQLNFGEFDISEMSLSSYLIARSRGADLVAIPVFPSRRFMQLWISYHVDAGIREPSDLVDRRLGVGEYQQTASLWQRGILEHDFGVSQYRVHWYMERTEELSHGGATGFTPPPGISFQRVPPDKSLATMLVNHELDAAVVSHAFDREWNLIDRSTRIRAAAEDWARVRPLFPDPVEECRRFFSKYGFVPPNHTYVIRGEVHRRHPWLAFNLFKAFVRAKEVAARRLAEDVPSALFLGQEFLRQVRSWFGDDPFPYGLRPNRPMLDVLVGFSHEQGLTPEKPRLEDLFAPSTLDLEA